MRTKEQKLKADREYSRRYRLKHKEKVRESKRLWEQNNPERRRLHRQASWAKRMLKDPSMTVDLVQSVYEQNIKKFGTLTCYLCLKRIEFGKDTLEHKIPISRGGTHDFNNLDISHRTCNISKGRKTLKEYRHGSNY